MVASSGAALPLVTFALDRAQALSHPLVFLLEDVGYAMLEVFEPAPQRPIHIGDDLTHRMWIEPPRLVTDHFPEFVPALVARPAIAALEVVSQEVEPAFLAGIDDARLGRVQRQSRRLRPLAQLFQHLLGFLLAPTQNDKVVRVAHHW